MSSPLCLMGSYIELFTGSVYLLLNITYHIIILQNNFKNFSAIKRTWFHLGSVIT